MLIHADSNSILLKARPPTVATLTSIFPRKSKTVDYEGHNLALPYNLTTVKVLRNMGINAPGPIRHGYDWPRPARFEHVFEHQYATADFLTMHNKCFVLNEMGCVDANTEYLSPTGWKRIADYDGGMVTQYDLATGAGELVQPTEYVKLPCTEMIRFQTDRGIDQLLSAEHRVLYWGSTGKPAVKLAHEVESAYHSTKRGWSGQFATTFAGAGGEGIPLTDAQLRVQVAAIADGYFGSQTNWCVIRVKKERKVDRVRALLADAGIAFKDETPEYEGAEGFHIFKFFAPLRAKEFDARFWAASASQLQVLADELHRWDGSERKAGARMFCSTSKASADFAQYVYTSTGRTASLTKTDRSETYKDLWVVHARAGAAKLFLKGTTSDGEKHDNVWREASPDGFKYCFEVPKTFLVLRRNGCVFITGNTSKTASMLWAADYLMRLGVVKRVLVVAPLSTLEQVWLNEIFDVCMHRTALVLHNNAEKRKELLAREVDFYIINHDGLKIIASDVIKRNDIDLIIVDEASNYRNGQTDRYAVLKKVVAKKKLWLATGAPCPNAPTDAWSLARLVDPSRVPEYFSQFKRKTMNQISQYKWVPKMGSHVDAFDAMQPAIRFKKSDCLDLPPVTYTNRSCALSPEQDKAYTQMKNYLVAEAATQQISAVNAADKIGKLRQILCGAVRLPNSTDYAVIPHGPRLRVLLEAIEQAAAKVLVIVPFKGIVHELKGEVMAHHVAQKDGKYCEVVNGDVTIAERNRIFQAFRDDPNLNELICHPQVMSHGLNMTQADMLIFYAPIYSNDQSMQVMDRINRPGQKRKMTILRIAANALERAIYAMVEGKRESQETILALYKKELAL